MTRRALRAPHLAVLAVLALTVAGCSAIDPATAHQGSAAPKPSAPPLISRQLQVAEHLVTQEGLAIALASNVLQTQLQLVSDSSTDTPTMTCTPLTGGGAKKITSRTGTTARVLSDVTYYDTGCARPYLTATATENEVGATDNLTASVTYTGPTGAALGRLATTAHATYTDAGLALEGTGIFTRKSGGPVSLGLACQSASDTLLNCD